MSDVKRNEFTKSLIGKIFGDVEIIDAFYYVDQTSHSPFCRIKCLKCAKDRVVSYCNLQRQVGTLHGDQCRGHQAEHNTIYNDPKYQFAKTLIGKNYGDKRVYDARWDYAHQDYKCDTECVICGSKFTYSLSLLNKGICNTHSNTCGSPKHIRQAKGNIYGVMKVLSVINMDDTVKSEVECQECGQKRFVKTDNIVFGNGIKHGRACSTALLNKFNLIGMTIGDFTAIDFYKRDDKHYTVLARCNVCGRLKEFFKDRFLSGVPTKHKNCVNKDLDIDSKFYKCWYDSKSRINNEKSERYHSYGGRGITTDFVNSVDFYDSLKQEYDAACDMFKHDVTIDRIDVNKGYTKDNVRFITSALQATNKQNTIYYRVVDKCGDIFYGHSFKTFCVNRNLSYNKMREVFYNRSNTVMGYTVTRLTRNEFMDVFTRLSDVYDKYQHLVDVINELREVLYVRKSKDLLSNKIWFSAIASMCGYIPQDMLLLLDMIPNPYNLSIRVIPNKHKTCFEITQKED